MNRSIYIHLLYICFIHSGIQGDYNQDGQWEEVNYIGELYRAKHSVDQLKRREFNLKNDKNACDARVCI